MEFKPTPLVRFLYNNNNNKNNDFFNLNPNLWDSSSYNIYGIQIYPSGKTFRIIRIIIIIIIIIIIRRIIRIIIIFLIKKK